MHVVAPVPVRLQRLALAALLLALAGCASMSKEECLTANWGEVGMRDGQNGEPRSRFASHAEACREAGIRADQGQYMSGWERGIVYFCTPHNGFEVGRRGRYYSSGTCPPALEGGFRHGYDRGIDIHRAQQEVDRVQNNIRDKQRKLDEAKTDDERRRLRRELTDLDFDMRRARDRLYDAERRARY
ncbi:MAG: DUF2799 domain-containing protein [Burkholderiaceae bacterium]